MNKLFRDIFPFFIGVTFFNIINTNAQMKLSAISATAKNKSIKVLELRNYLLKPGKRDSFINFFEANFIKSQNALGGYIIGQFRVKGAPDNFFWLRGFEDMDSRSKYLPEFYKSEFWKERRTIANDLINNNDNVYLIKPLSLSGENKDTAINSSDIGKLGGITIIDFYIANDKLDELILFFRNKYVPFLRGLGILDFTMWRSETQVNDFPSLPVFQDKNLLVTISHFKNEKEYMAKRKKINSLTHQQMKISMNEVVTTKTTIILYPTVNSGLQ
ncbi:MAG: NIPSNAP family protein [Ginsengibacter sp.]